MILTQSDIKDIIESNPNKKDVEFARRTRNDLFMHIYGENLSAYLQRIGGYENEHQHAARKKYARSNRDIMERITRPTDKVFSAAGGSTYYNLPKSKEKELHNRLNNIENGLSLRKWMEQLWKPAYLADPMGIVYVEIDANGEAYPTYKGSNEIVSYKLNGRNLDYVVFKHEATAPVVVDGIEVKDNARYYRVVDDAFDYVVKYDDGRVSIITEETYPNHFERVPAIINSDIPVIGSDWFCSPLQPVVELANEFLRECSVKSIYKMLHGFPKYWEYQTACSNCNGVGTVGAETCPVCKGTGSKLRSDVTETRLLPVPQGDGAPVLAPHIAGYVTPPIDAWKAMSEELRLLEELMFETIWGTKQIVDAENDTATGKFIDAQPINERLAKIADAAETVEQYITDTIGFLYYGEAYKGASISYGRRFQIESPDTIWEKYKTARTSGAPDTMLDDILREYLQSKYDNNSIELQRQLKLIALEPFVHLTAMQVKALDLDPAEYLKKVYFTEFVSTLAENEVLTSPLDTLKEKLSIFTSTKKINENTGSNRPDPNTNSGR